MAKKPSYEELERRIKELDEESAEHKRARAALQISEEKWRSITENSPDHIMVLGTDYSIQYINYTVPDLTIEQVMGKSCLDFVPLDYHQVATECFDRVMKTGKLDHYETKYTTAEGETQYFNVRIAPLMGEGGNIIGLISVSNNNTERKLAEEQLKKNQFYLAKAQELGQIGTWELDLGLNRLVWNDENCRIFGVPPGSVVNYEIFLDKVHPDDREYVDREWKAALNGKPYDIDHRILVDDQIRWVREKADVEFNEDGKALLAVGFTQDISKGKLAEEESSFTKERLFKVLETIPAFAYLQAPDYTIQYANHKFRTIFRDPAPEGKICYEVIAGRKEPCENCPTFKVFEENNSQEWEWVNTGTEETYMIYDYSLPDKDGSPLVLEFGIDITALKNSEKQLRQSQKMESIGTLAGGIAHDFNNILGIIVGNTELAMNDVPEWDQTRHNLEAVIKATLRARDMVKQILAFSRQTEQEQKPVRIGPIIKESVKLLRSSIPTIINIREEYSAHADTILGDPTQINQILMNLCSNAAHAMREKGGFLEVELKNIDFTMDDLTLYPDLTPGKYLTLTVGDTGQGMKPEIVERIFDPYFTTKEIGEGTGMGLSVVHGIVKNHNGAIRVHSEPGKGTTFSVYFPLIESLPVPELKSLESLPTGTERVLFVDDEKALADLGERMLSHFGYEVTVRTSSIEALEAFKAQPDKYDLVITDMTMPNMTGVDLSQELLRFRPDIPIIICTGFSEIITEDKAKQMGIKAFVMKPFVLREIAQTVRQVLDQKE